MAEQTRFAFTLGPELSSLMTFPEAARMVGQQTKVTWGDKEVRAVVERVDFDLDDFKITLLIDGPLEPLARKSLTVSLPSAGGEVLDPLHPGSLAGD